jgi:hypothetical protein
MTRNWDGSPETDADTRAHDLRQLRYKGLIDVEGRACPSVPQWFADRLSVDQYGLPCTRVHCASSDRSDMELER